MAVNSNIATLRRRCLSNSQGWGKNQSNAPHMPNLPPLGLTLIDALQNHSFSMFKQQGI
jgi:hypothetical protein